MPARRRRISAMLESTRGSQRVPPIRLASCLWVTREDVLDVEVLSLVGELDAAGTARLLAVVAEQSAPTVIVDLTGLVFIDGGGMQALRAARNDLLRRGTRVHLAGARPCVQRLFSLVGAAAELE